MRASRLAVTPVFSLGSAAVLAVAFAAELAGQGYQLPPQPIVDCLDAEPAPRLSLSPTRDYALLTTTESMPSLAVQSRPILRLAGLRIDSATRGPQLGQRTYAMSLLRIADGTTRKIDLPKSIHIGDIRWAADGKRIAFSNTNTVTNNIEVWVVEVGKGFARRIGNVRLGSALRAGRRSTGAIQWMPDQQTLLCRLTPSDASPPAQPAVPSGPNIQESKGVKAPVRTYQDLLANEHDARLFEYFSTLR